MRRRSSTDYCCVNCDTVYRKDQASGNLSVFSQPPAGPRTPDVVEEPDVGCLAGQDFVRVESPETPPPQKVNSGGPSGSAEALGEEVGSRVVDEKTTVKALAEKVLEGCTLCATLCPR